MEMRDLQDLFVEQLRDLYSAEKQLVKALPKMAKKASDEGLKQAFTTHLEETKGHVERLEQIFDNLGKKASGKTCEAIKGIIEEGEEIMDDFEDSDALDAGLIAAGQAVEHYEISRYGTLRTWAQQLGMRDAAKLLDQTLAEEKKTDELFTQLAEARANPKADKAA